MGSTKYAAITSEAIESAYPTVGLYCTLSPPLFILFSFSSIFLPHPLFLTVLEQEVARAPTVR